MAELRPGVEEAACRARDTAGHGCDPRILGDDKRLSPVRDQTARTANRLCR